MILTPSFIIARNNTKKTIFKCDDCGKTYIRELSLHKHRKYDCLMKDALYRCHLCSFSSKGKLRLSEHYKIKHDPNTKFYYCKFCPWYTKTHKSPFKSNLSKIAGRDMKCPFCNFVAQREADLNNHVIRVHIPTPVYFYCDQCSYKSKRRYDLGRHMALRHGTLPSKRKQAS
ncbi:hypothetical protein AAG570_013968 [Ranatra chinensis]|uniref:C2H2-type domain-containing protein n=1 Tax=Ranatra chinensis TaxID=642074 RepID=A0ABD0YSE9_9HEMI